MKSSITFIVVCLLLTTTNLFAQTKKTNPPTEQPTNAAPLDFKDIRMGIQKTRNQEPSPLRNFKATGKLYKPLQNQPNIQMKRDEKTGLPIWISGTEKDAESIRNKSDENKCLSYLQAIKNPLRINDPATEFVMTKMEEDDLGQKHILMQQMFQGIKVYGSELKMHEKDGDIFLVNGRHFPTPEISTISPTINARDVEDFVKTKFDNFKVLPADQKRFVSGEQLQSELVIYHVNENHREARLAYHITIIPSLTDRWEYFVDAHTNEVLNKYESICKIHNHAHGSCSGHAHEGEDFLKKNENSKLEGNFKLPSNTTLNGPVTANAIDLLGISRTINTYEIGGDYFMYDGSRSMFDAAASNLPSEPIGMIVTVDGQNTYPGNSSFDYQVIVSGNNTWSSPSSVSAHYNGGKAYEYFKNTHGRESINGQGGNIISFINISDENGNDFDNAFWNGAAMFYGNGDQAFTAPLAKALDVAGHEMSHGVIQSTANLEYQNQSGALNESFADIFGAMIDRDDWHLGEDITNSNYIPTGRLRSLSDPNNGGSSLNTPGWQPRTMSEYQNLPNTPQGDNGGVHINSGIVNYAYYLFATDIGKDKAEQIYYRALRQYLVKSSQFVDLRNAVVQSATDLYGATEVNAANSAFDAVGIGAGAGNNYQNDVNTNDGDEFVLHSDADLGRIYISDLNGNLVADPALSESDPISRLSISDDGTLIVFVNSENNLRFISIDWANGTADEDNIETNPSGDWANVVISKDGNRIAMNKNILENKIYVYDFDLQQSKEFVLSNPTTSDPNTGGTIATGDVQYADAMEFDFSGEFVMYDAFNKIEGNLGTVEYWDIGFLNVFNNSSNNFASGSIEKLFNGLPENVSIGNPTFAKNSPYIVAFDYREEGFFNSTYQVLGANVQTGATDLIVENTTWSYPNYSVNDDKVIYDMPYDNQGTTTTVLGVIDINADKISGNASTSTFLFPNGTVAEKWGAWFATGERELVGTNDVLLEALQFKAYPNPVDENITIELESETSENALVSIFDLMGKKVMDQNVNIQVGKNVTELSMTGLPSGPYFLVFNMEKGNATLKVMKN